jgi:hypothetical protein
MHLKLLDSIQDYVYFYIMLYKHYNMKDSSISDCMVVDQVESEELIGIPICGANLSTPVIDTSNFISEIHYLIGSKLLHRKCGLA